MKAMIPDDIQFSKSNLQDFVECPRRFQLRYIQRLAWPAIETEPALEHERELRRGSQFHHMIHQHLLGVPEERLSAMVHDEELQRWWQAYLAYIPELIPSETSPASGLADQPARFYAETALTAPLNNYRLIAKYDLLLFLADGKIRILDWKTTRQPPSPQRHRALETHLQSRVYPYTLCQAGAQFNGGEPISPENIEMVYWFATSPEYPDIYAYSTRQFQEDEGYLTSLIEQIYRQEGEFPKTTDEKRCRFCVYRSLCERGVAAGILETGLRLDTGDETELWNFEDIPEIAF